MVINEQQLEAWSHRGAMASSEAAHKSARLALESHSWPSGMNHRAYLQGSYPNATNIRGNSDVDLVVETDLVFYSNLTAEEKSQLGFQQGGYTWVDFRAQVLLALQNYYGQDLVDGTADKCIKIKPSQNRLPIDVVPCVLYRDYANLRCTGSGITFWTIQSNIQIVNYPKAHLDNGASKNQRVSGKYKPSIRMFKNARERFPGFGEEKGNAFPSYFIECLISNVPDRCFQKPLWGEIYIASVNFLLDAAQSDQLKTFATQSEHQLLFGPKSCQWDEESGRQFIDALICLWNGS